MAFLVGLYVGAGANRWASDSYASSGTPVVKVFTPIADSYANQTNPNNTYADKTPLITKHGSSTKKNIFLKFDLQNTGNTTITGAKLRLKVVDGSAEMQNYRFVNTAAWEENTLSWNNQPYLPPLISATTKATKAGTWIEVPLDSLTSKMKGNVFTISIDTPNGGDVFGIDSRETANAPQLLVTYTSEATPITPSVAVPSVAISSTLTPVVPSVTPVISPTTSMVSPTTMVISPTIAVPTAAPVTPIVQPTTGPITVTGKTYYVATNGADANDGSPERPWKTIATAMTKLQAGDLLYVRGGEYLQSVSNPKVAAGTASAPIQVVAYAGERPVIKGLFLIKDANYWYFNGINITWNGSSLAGEHMTKFSGGTGWKFMNGEIWNSHSYASMSITDGAAPATGWTVSGTYFHDAADCRSQCVGEKHSDNQDHHIYANKSGPGVIEHNIFYKTPNGRGIKLGPASSGNEGPDGIIIRYNTFYDNVGPANIQLSYGSRNTQIYRNLMQKSKAGYFNVQNNNLNGTGNVVHDNIGWESAGVVEADPTYLKDTGGNKMIDPQLNFSTYKPANAAAAEYGRYAQ